MSEPEQSAHISHWLRQAQDGDGDAVQRLWEVYFGKMVQLARARLRGAKPAIANEEDLALSAFASFCEHAQNGRYPSIADRGDLWRLLVTITARKVSNLVRSEYRLKRGGHVEREFVDIENIVGVTPTPEFAAQCAEQYQVLLERLNDPDLVELAIAKMQGYSNDEIAAKRQCANRTIERKLKLIRTIWTEADG